MIRLDPRPLWSLLVTVTSIKLLTVWLQGLLSLPLSEIDAYGYPLWRALNWRSNLQRGDKSVINMSQPFRTAGSVIIQNYSQRSGKK